jgi:ADP-ribosylation factor 2-binding protein
MATGCTTTAIHSNGKSNGHGAIHEEIFSENSGDSQELLFDTIVGHLQDLVIEDQFTEIQQSFMDKHYRHFENVDENKLIYTDIHKQYIELIEAYIERKLLEKCPQFNMESFSKMLE